MMEKQSIASKINNIVSGVKNKVKSEYGYLKSGINESIKNDPKVKSEVAKNNLRAKNIREGNPEQNFKLDKY